MVGLCWWWLLWLCFGLIAMGLFGCVCFVCSLVCVFFGLFGLVVFWCVWVIVVLGVLFMVVLVGWFGVSAACGDLV